MIQNIPEYGYFGVLELDGSTFLSGGAVVA